MDGDGLKLTATGNLSRAVVTEMRAVLEWPDFDKAGAFRLHKVVNEPDYLPLHFARLVAQQASIFREHRGKLVVTPLGRRILTGDAQGALPALLFHIAFWRCNLAYFSRDFLGSWPQSDMGIVLWSLSVAASDWQPRERLMRLCTIPLNGVLDAMVDLPGYAFEARVLRPLVWFGLMECRRERTSPASVETRRSYRKTALFDRLLAFDIKIEGADGRPN
jgi:hypothetical protein